MVGIDFSISVYFWINHWRSFAEALKLMAYSFIFLVVVFYVLCFYREINTLPLIMQRIPYLNKLHVLHFWFTRKSTKPFAQLNQSTRVD